MTNKNQRTKLYFKWTANHSEEKMNSSKQFMNIKKKSIVCSAQGKSTYDCNLHLNGSWKKFFFTYTNIYIQETGSEKKNNVNAGKC